MDNIKSYSEGELAFNKKVDSHMRQVKRTVYGNEKRKKQAVRDWYYGKKID